MEHRKEFMKINDCTRGPVRKRNSRDERILKASRDGRKTKHSHRVKSRKDKLRAASESLRKSESQSRILELDRLDSTLTLDGSLNTWKASKNFSLMYRLPR